MLGVYNTYNFTRDLYQFQMKDGVCLSVTFVPLTLIYMRINRYAKHWEQCPSYWVIRLCVKLYYFLVSNRDLKWKVLLCIIIWLIYYNCTHESSETIFILNKCIISLKKQTVSNYFHRTINRFQFRLINHHQYLLLSSIYWI